MLSCFCCSTSTNSLKAGIVALGTVDILLQRSGGHVVARLVSVSPAPAFVDYGGLRWRQAHSLPSGVMVYRPESLRPRGLSEYHKLAERRRQLEAISEARRNRRFGF